MRCIISEYHVIEAIFKDEQCLLESLEEMGYKPIVHNEGIALHNRYSKSIPTAHIVVSQSQVGGYGDLGFERTKEGFVMHRDGGRLDIQQLNKTYVENKVRKYANSTSGCNILSSSENKKGQIEIQLRVG